MRNTAVAWTALLTAVVVVLTGCAGTATARTDPAESFAERAAKVAAAWQTMITQAHRSAWQTGIIALQPLTSPPAGQLSDDLRRAFDSGWYRTRVPLPTQIPAASRISFPDGSTADVSLVSAAAAFAELHRADPPCAAGPVPATPATPTGTGPGAPVGGPARHTCAFLTVTGVKDGTMQLRTNRGVATVPAWLFSVDESPSPVARAAVTPATFDPPPVPDVPSWSHPLVASATKVDAVEPNRIAFTIASSGCATNPAGLVHETDDAVVIAGWTQDDSTGPCRGSAALVPVSVPLTRPLGDRVILDAVSGRPLL